MPILKMKFLGGLNLSLDNIPLKDLKTKKGKALICYLAVNGKSVSRSGLAGLLWPDMPEANARTNLRKALNRLKPLSSYLEITREVLSMRQDTEYCIDVVEFEAQAAATAATSRLQNAAASYEGDFLEGFSLGDAPIFEEWMLSQRARLRELAMETLDTLIAQLSAQGAHEAAIHYTRQALTIEPWHERAYRELMRLLALSGQRSEALRQYENCRRLLADELGVAPDPLTVQLYEQIKTGKLEGMGAGSGDLSPSYPAPPFRNLPVQTTPFLGRESELAALAGYISDPQVRLVTILGPGGMGKTRLALAAAEAQLTGQNPPPLFSQGIFFISLASLESPELLVPAIAEAIRLRFFEQADLKGQLLNYLRQKSMLLILDNFEHLLSGVGLVDEILRTAPGVTLLITSRARLNLQSEQLFPIGGMEYPRANVPMEGEISPGLARYSGLQLFQQEARRVLPAFTLTPEDLPCVLDICRLVQGMPLGIVLAAACAGSLSLEDILKEMRRDPDFLASEMGDIPRRQQSLRAAFNHSWRLLSEREQSIYQQISIFRGGFTRQAVQAITGASVRDIQGLVNKSLLALLPNGRYEVHELLRQFAAEKLAESPNLEVEIRDNHSAYYCDLLHQHQDLWHTARQLDTLGEITLEAYNIELAWRRAVEQADWQHLLQATESWNLYLRWQGRIVDGEHFCGTVINRIEQQDAEGEKLSPTCIRLWATAMTWHGNFAQSHSVAIQRLQYCLTTLERPELAEQDVRRERAFILQGLARRFYDQDRQKERELLDHSLSLYQELGDASGIAISLHLLGALDWGTGHYTAAQQRLQTGMAILQSLGDRSEQAYVIARLAWVYQHLGDLEKAEGLRRDTLDLVQQLGNRSGLAPHAANLAYTLIWRGKLEEALQWAEKSLRLGQEYGTSGDEGYLRLAIGLTSLIAGNYEKAREELTLALEKVKEIDSYGVRATIHYALGCLDLVEKSYKQAETEFFESYRLYQQVQDNLLGLALSALGYVSYFRNDIDKTRHFLLEVLKIAVELKDYIHLVTSLPVAALFFTRVGKARRALQVWEAARSQPHIANSRWHEDVVGQVIRTAASVLTPDELETARSLGRETSLWEMAEALIQEIEL